MPQVLYQVGESFKTEGKPDEAIAAWETLVGKFSDTKPAAHAHFRTAALLEEQKGDLAGAIERYRKVAADPWRSQAGQRVAVMEARR